MLCNNTRLCFLRALFPLRFLLSSLAIPDRSHSCLLLSQTHRAANSWCATLSASFKTFRCPPARSRRNSFPSVRSTTTRPRTWDGTTRDADRDRWQLAERGGAQGDYREGMAAKIANVIDCLKTEPLSKRAVIPIPFAEAPSSTADWKDQGQNKCCRELHFYLEDGKAQVHGHCADAERQHFCEKHSLFCHADRARGPGTGRRARG